MTPPVLKFASRFEYNTIFIVDGLCTDEAQTGRNLYNDLRDMRADGADVAVIYSRVTHAGCVASWRKSSICLGTASSQFCTSNATATLKAAWQSAMSKIGFLGRL